MTVGCIIANLINMAVSGTGALGLLDVVFGSCATLVGALICWKLREHPKAAVLGPVVANAVIVPAYLPLLLQGLGYYTIPFTTIALDGLYLPMYLFGLVATGIGEALVMYVLGLPLFSALKRFGVLGRARLADEGFARRRLTPVACDRGYNKEPIANSGPRVRSGRRRMNPVVIIPTFISASRSRRDGRSVTTGYDHMTSIAQQGELGRCLSSLEKVEGLGLVIVLVAADPGIENQAAEKVRAVAAAHPEVNTLVMGAPELALVRQRMEQLSIGSLRAEIGLSGYGAVRNLGLVVANTLGFDAVVFLDDDEVVDDPRFLRHAMYGLGKLTKKGVPILVKTGYYLNDRGSYLSKWEDKWYNRFWQQGRAFNEWISSAMKGPRLSRSNHVCGGCLAVHKEAFKRLAFDPWIARGEDLDYMLNLRMYGSDIWFDNKWVLRHLRLKRKTRASLPPGHLPVDLRIPQARVQPRAHRPSADQASVARAPTRPVSGARPGQAHPPDGVSAQPRPSRQEGVSPRRESRDGRGVGLRRAELLEVLRIPIRMARGDGPSRQRQDPHHGARPLLRGRARARRAFRRVLRARGSPPCDRSRHDVRDSPQHCGIAVW